MMDPVQLVNGEIVAFTRTIKLDGFTWYEAVVGPRALEGFGVVLGEVFPARDGTFTLYTEAEDEADDDLHGDYEVQDVTVAGFADAVRAWHRTLMIGDDSEEEILVLDEVDYHDDDSYNDGDPYDIEYDVP